MKMETAQLPSIFPLCGPKRFTEVAHCRRSRWPMCAPTLILLLVMAKQKLPSKEREELRNNWLAPAGSARAPDAREAS